MAQEEKSFLESLEIWKKNKWVLFAAEDHKKFWSNLSGQYKITLRPDISSTLLKTIYIGDDLKKALEAYVNLSNFQPPQKNLKNMERFESSWTQNKKY